MSNLVGLPVTPSGPSLGRIQTPASIVTVIPIGLREDPDLTGLGITNRGLKHYLIVLLLAGNSLSQEVHDSRQLLDRLLLTIRDQR